MKLPEVECPQTVPSLAWVYILQSDDDCFYVGYSRDVGERLRKHRYGIGSKHTRDHRGARLVFVEGRSWPSSPFDRPADGRERWMPARRTPAEAGPDKLCDQPARAVNAPPPRTTPSR
ncbi:MAG: GIY-YIG nuclease family protein [Verrucomicrobia bacterium]|nr:GIY-YIG nuclease family protein [Verrucomicrobiota bacterium]